LPITAYSFKTKKVKQRFFRSSVFQVIKQNSTDLKINQYGNIRELTKYASALSGITFRK